MRKLPSIEKAYKEHKKQIMSIAWKFAQSTGIEFEELFSEGCLEFCRKFPQWNPDRAKLSTFVHITISRRLSVFIKDEIKKKNIPIILPCSFCQQEPLIEQFIGSKKELTIIEYIQKHPHTKLGKIRLFLRQKGWKHIAINTAIKEIKQNI